jgi:peptidoglycan-N-acetylglucosamine deacetylase
MKSKLPCLLFFLVLQGIGELTIAQFVWPHGAKAAICLTYDDALDCQLDIAIPQLDSAGVNATFFCTGNSSSLNKRMEEWRTAVQNGHELGNHSLFHPCVKNRPDKSVFAWVKPEYDLGNYSFAQFFNELQTANTLLMAIDGREERTYGYTCGDYAAGGVNFADSLKYLFIAARCDGPIPESMEGYNVFKTPSWCVDGNSAEELIAYVNKARENGTIAIFMFHNVGGGNLNVGAAEHRELLKYIDDNRKDFYCATFKEVMTYVKNYKQIIGLESK